MHWKDRIRQNPYPYTLPRENDAKKAAIIALIIVLPAIASVAGMWLGMTAKKCDTTAQKVSMVDPRTTITGKQPRRTKIYYDRIDPDPRINSNVKLTVKGNETIVERTE